MEKFNLPVLLPKDAQVIITQPFGATSNPIEPPGEHGEAHFHYGVDFVFGDPLQTYGTPLVCPFKGAKLGGYMKPPGTIANTPYVNVRGKGESGNYYELILAHVGNIFFRDSYTEGQIIATVGNYGNVSPLPTTLDPVAGSHLHMGVRVNGVWDDPLKYFDPQHPYIDANFTDSAQLTRLAWSLQRVVEQIANYKTVS